MGCRGCGRTIDLFCSCTLFVLSTTTTPPLCYSALSDANYLISIYHHNYHSYYCSVYCFGKYGWRVVWSGDCWWIVIFWTVSWAIVFEYWPCHRTTPFMAEWVTVVVIWWYIWANITIRHVRTVLNWVVTWIWGSKGSWSAYYMISSHLPSIIAAVEVLANLQPFHISSIHL